MNNDIIQRAAAHWTDVSKNGSNKILRWWQSPRIWSHINNVLDASDTRGDVHGGFHRLLAKFSNRGNFQRAVSVGCGTGEKELRLLRSGMIKHFDLYEISEHRIKLGMARATELGVADKVRFICGDAFELCHNNDFDLVYWNNSLHHMLDVNQAIIWSKQVLLNDGIFAMDDFVGPSRFQWTDRNLEFASKFRATLTRDLLVDPRNLDRILKVELRRPSIDGMIRSDPSEAADSGNILNAIKSHFPNSKFIPTGGAIYHIGMNDIIGNVMTENHDSYINLGLIIDRLLMDEGEFHYAVCIARVKKFSLQNTIQENTHC